jgi:hypothetical protein
MVAHMPDNYETLLENYRNARQALRMVRETIETLGPPGTLPSEEAVNSLYGPEPVHEAQAIVDAAGHHPERSGRSCTPTCPNRNTPLASIRSAS